MMPQALNRLRNSSTTVMRRMLASKKAVEEIRVEDFFYFDSNMRKTPYPAGRLQIIDIPREK
jgi:hypothetical protein